MHRVQLCHPRVWLLRQYGGRCQTIGMLSIPAMAPAATAPAAAARCPSHTLFSRRPIHLRSAAFGQGSAVGASPLPTPVCLVLTQCHTETPHMYLGTPVAYSPPQRQRTSPGPMYSYTAAAGQAPAAVWPGYAAPLPAEAAANLSAVGGPEPGSRGSRDSRLGGQPPPPLSQVSG